MSLLVARVLSIIGHPALAMPFAATFSAVQRDASSSVVGIVAAAAVVVAVIITVFSVLQVRAGRWSHVDASVPTERLRLNLFLAGLLLIVAGLLWITSQSLTLVTGWGLSSAIIFAALASARWLEISLHCAFGAYATLLLWPALLPVAVLLALTVGVAWSRLKLQRHTVAEVVAGLVLGALAGWVFNIVAVSVASQVR